MALQRGIDGSEPLRPEPVEHLDETLEQRRATAVWQLATGTLACPSCDAPVAPAGTLAPADPLACPVCDHAAAVRDFLSLAAPSRPARVAVYVIRPPRPAALPA